MSIEGQGHFFTIYFPGFVWFVLTRPRYQVSVYRTIGPLVITLCYVLKIFFTKTEDFNVKATNFDNCNVKATNFDSCNVNATNFDSGKTKLYYTYQMS